MNEEEREKCFIERLQKQYGIVMPVKGEEMFDLSKFRGNILDAHDYLWLCCKRFEPAEAEKFENDSPIWYYGNTTKNLSQNASEELEIELDYNGSLLKCIDAGNKLRINEYSSIWKDKYIGKGWSTSAFGKLIKPSKFALNKKSFMDLYCIMYSQNCFGKMYSPTSQAQMAFEQ